MDRLKHLKKFVCDHYGDDDTKVRLLSRKGVYPYSFMDSMEKFDYGKIEF